MECAEDRTCRVVSPRDLARHCSVLEVFATGGGRAERQQLDGLHASKNAFGGASESIRNRLACPKLHMIQNRQSQRDVVAVDLK